MAEYIERAKALMLIDEVHGARSAYHRVKNIPAADVVPVVHGKWTEKDNSMYDLYMRENIHWSTYICSACNGEVMKDFRYCPNCGARMDGE